MTEFLKKLMLTHGVTSDEGRVTKIIENEIRPYVDEISYDALGNLIALKKSKSADAKKMMLCAHADEIGFITMFIQDDGLIRIAPVGGIDFVAYSYCTVISSKGVKGVIAPEEGTKPEELKADKFFIDIGAKSKKEAEKKVALGDMFTVIPHMTKLSGSRYCGRPFDNRAGCAVMVEIAKGLRDCVNDVYFVFSSMEEVGLRGAKAATYNVNPDYGIAFDVTDVGDVPGCKPMAVKLGDGAAIKIKDSSVLCDIKLVSYLTELAKEHKIKHQFEILRAGGTDTAVMQTEAGGARVGCISIPTRYIHTQNETIDMKDMAECVKLGTLACNIRL